jgi:hypothetical protein
MALLVAAEANGMGLHFQVYLSFGRKKPIGTQINLARLRRNQKNFIGHR